MIKPAVSQPRADRALTPALSRNGRGSEAEILIIGPSPRPSPETGEGARQRF
jgi:hypothetical protein